MGVFVISLGGSLVVPNGIDIGFLESFKNMILEFIERGDRFVLVVGGGKTSRKYQEAARELGVTSDDEIDWIGVRSTILNANLVKSVFDDECHSVIISNPEDEINFEENILVASGWKPGFSTDYDSVVLARNLGASKVINLSNIDHVYDSDPNGNDDAKPISRLSWDEYLQLIPNEWKPGLHTPFDPIAAKEAQEDGVEVAIMSGDLENLRDYLENKEFKGTVIR